MANEKMDGLVINDIFLTVEEMRDRERVLSIEGCDEALADFLAQKGVEVVICGGLGEGTRRDGCLHGRLAGGLLRLSGLSRRLHPRRAEGDPSRARFSDPHCDAVHAEDEGAGMGARREARRVRSHRERNRHVLQRHPGDRLRKVPRVQVAEQGTARI